AAGVEDDEAVVGAHGDGVAERLDDRDAVGHLGQLLGDPVGRLVGDARVDDAGGQRQQVGHPGIVARPPGRGHIWASARSRSTYFSTLPVALSGSSSTTSTERGTL